MDYLNNIYPEVIDMFWDDPVSKPHHRIDIKRHPIRDSGGNPWVLDSHLGGLKKYGMHDIWVSGNPGNSFANWLNQIELDVHFDIISIETTRGAWQTPTAVPHLSGTYNEPQTHFGFWPENFTSAGSGFRWLYDHAKELGLAQNKGFVKGCSAGANLWMINMCQGTLSGVRGVINQSGPIDYRAVNGVDTVFWSYHTHYHNTQTQAAWNALPLLKKQQMSVMWWIARGFTQSFVPIYTIFEQVGDGIKPYGDPARPNSNVHDAAMYPTLDNVLTIANLPHSGNLIPRNHWNDPVAGPIVSSGVYQWMVNILNS